MNRIQSLKIALDNGLQIEISLDEARQLLAELRALLDPPKPEMIPQIVPYYPPVIQPWWPQTVPSDSTGTLPFPWRTEITWCRAGYEANTAESKETQP